MKVGIIGSGGREHSLCEALNKSKKISKIYCFPGNAGTQQIAENIDINIDDFEILKKFVISRQIDMKMLIVIFLILATLEIRLKKKFIMK